MSDQELHKRIDAVLDTVRPNIQMDGGDIKFAGFRDGAVYIKFQGACVGCPMSEITLQMGIEDALKEEIPEVERVVALDENTESETAFM